MTDDREIETRLRTALTAEADSVDPADRLAEIRTATAPIRRPGWRTWLTPLAAAAVVAAIAVGAWFGLRPGTSTPTPVGTTPPVAAPTTPPSGTTDPSSSPTSGAAVSTEAVVLPVFHVAGVSTATGFGLVRELVPVTLPAGASVEDRANAALALAVTLPTDNPNHFLAAWPPGTRATWVTMPDPEIGISLSGAGDPQLTEGADRLVVQALVWTVTAVAQREAAPVPVVVASGGAIFPGLDANVFKRPSTDRAFEEVAPVWVDGPHAGQRVSATAPVVVTGQACAAEGTVAWELSLNDAVVRTGSTTASSRCPEQGTWSVDLGSLAPGRYAVRALERSAQDGRTVASVVVPFTVG